MSLPLRGAFETARADGRAVFIGFITASYPTPADTVPLMLAMEKAGCGVIELGVPYSDPLADGPTIQAANAVSLSHGTTLEACLAHVRAARDQGLRAPVVLMGYCNPFLRAAGDDPASLAASMHASGVSGVILVDLPPDAGLPGQVHHSLFAALTAQGVPPVPLAAPTTAPHRLRALMAAAKDGFLYCVSVAGVTGTRDALPEGLAEWVAGLRAAAGGEDEARYGAML